MKNVITNTILAAAILAISVSPAVAQTSTKFKAEIPFAFQVGGQTYAAGSYSATVKTSTGGQRFLTISTDDRSVTKIAMANGSLSPKSAGDLAAKMVFRCADGGCALIQVWSGNSPEGMLFNAPKQAAFGTQRLAAVRLQVAKGD